MRYFNRRFLLSFVLILMVTPVSYAQERLSSPIKRIQPAIVTIITYDADGKILTQGTGFFISKGGDLITNYHVIKGCRSAIIKTYTGSTYPIKRIVAEDRSCDLVQLLADISGASVQTLLVTRVIPSVGDRI